MIPVNQNKFFPRLFPEDKIALFFSGFVIAFQIYYGLYSSVIAPLVFVFLLIALIYFQSHNSSKVLRFFRSYIHIPLYGIIFAAFQTFVHKLNPNDYDTLLAKVDLILFRIDVTVWFEKIISNTLTEVLTISYFSYYVLPSVTFLLLFIQKGKADSNIIAAKYLLSIVIGWYFAFLLYAALPAAGPDIAFPGNYSVTLTGLSPLTNTYLQNLGHYLRESNIRNTFPSMHFCIILITNYFAFKYRRNYFLFCTLPLGIMLGTATLYLRQHYLIDLAGSLPMAAISIYISSKISARKN